MKSQARISIKITALLTLLVCLSPVHAKPVSEAFKEYWYAGDAELTSYKLSQARYGELHQGTSVLVYVTEPFLRKEQVKADSENPENISVLKLNATKKFLTGIYPYSIMTSTFSPVSNDSHAIKVSMSTQEWCGHVFTQLNNRQKFEINAYSYFEGEADQDFTLAKNHLENEIWTKIRLDPNSLPIGAIRMIPPFEYVRLLHQQLTDYAAKTSLTTSGKTSTYTIEYPSLTRSISIEFNTEFPHVIQGWQETYKSGFDEKAKVLTSSGKIINTIKSKYWQQHNNVDESLRKALGL